MKYDLSCMTKNICWLCGVL